MAATIDPAEWTTSANQAIKLAIVPASATSLTADVEQVQISTFHPNFTYPIFGEAEQIYGYKGLDVKLYFKSDDLSPLLDIHYDAKLEDDTPNLVPSKGKAAMVRNIDEDDEEEGDEDEDENEGQIDDVLALLKEHLPEDTSLDSALYDLKLNDSKPNTFKPPGQQITTFTDPKTNRLYEVYCAPLSDPHCNKLLSNIQILVYFLIEGGRPIIDKDEWSLNRWTVYFLYEKIAEEVYSIVGYCTVYNHFWFALDVTTNLRSRISQFIILPSCQGKGFGSKLYTIIRTHLFDQDQVREITVEDPSERFEEMRDRCDLRFLRKNGTFTASSLDLLSRSHNSYDEYVEVTHPLNKMPRRQFARVLEMHLLSLIDQAPDTAENAELRTRYRHFVKLRLFRHNKEVLKQLDKKERLEKLQETFDSVVEDYAQMMEGMNSGDTSEAVAKTPRHKRTLSLTKSDPFNGESEETSPRVVGDTRPHKKTKK